MDIQAQALRKRTLDITREFFYAYASSGELVRTEPTIITKTANIKPTTVALAKLYTAPDIAPNT